MNMKNVIAIYKLTKIFHLLTINKQPLSYIETCFTVLVGTENFLKLDYDLVSIILGSSNLHVTSELEVLRATHLWLSYKFGERKKYGKYLLAKVRFELMSDHSLRSILSGSFSISKIDDCVLMVKRVLENKRKLEVSIPGTYRKHRFCSQSNFNMLVLGGYKRGYRKVIKNVNEISGHNLGNLKALSPMKEGRKYSKAVCIKDEIYVFAGYICNTLTGLVRGLSIYDGNRKYITSVERYSLATNAWDKVSEMRDGREDYCICSFMDKVFVIGGRHSDLTPAGSCLEFSTKSHVWRRVSRTNEDRSYRAAAAVYRGNIVVCGGRNRNGGLRSAERFDVASSGWLPMQSMVGIKWGHSAVVANEKLFVFGTSCCMGCEVFDGERFVSLKSPKFPLRNISETVSIATKIYVFFGHNDEVACYDLDRNEWSCKCLKLKIKGFTIAKVPWF